MWGNSVGVGVLVGSGVAVGSGLGIGVGVNVGTGVAVGAVVEIIVASTDFLLHAHRKDSMIPRPTTKSFVFFTFFFLSTFESFLKF